LDREYSRQISRIADHLRHFADDIERLAGRRPYDRDGRAQHVAKAINVLNEVRAMNGNMVMLEQLMVAANDAQREFDNPLERRSST
jgi:hypothetical protein